ncbi:hypothetical protein DAPPUDRAFT_191054 [Daphnia pulex]|uniref:PLAC domain-containing protein n=1 Tax=Daphnia pulex TaxID=6669 RepID=E9FVK8_DAPPU|nr:hypothetical protein DAPPUDRAFT_191054 [Daphnia pulex]|eukprot:EFX88574.1 hypothetical protein DAPPUDRAFT_191054 [Daphnia pulex]
MLFFIFQTIGCDGIVGSDKRPDACGVCGGSNSTCQIVSGIFTEPQLPPGYNLVAQLPKGACHVNITEFKPSRNYLALRRSDGTFVFNGNWAINWSGEYQAAGTTFAYRRQDTITPELITTQGPLTEPIDIMVIYQQINPGIKYEYMLPLGVANSNIVPRPSNNPSPTVQKLQAIDPNVATPPPHRRGPRRHPNGKGFVWKQVGFSECSKTCGGGVQQALIVCVRDRDQVPVADHRCKEEDRPPSETVRCGPKPCPADWVLGEWTPCTVTCGDGIQTRDLTCKQEISATLTMRVNEAACLGAAPLVPRVRNCNLGHCAKWHTSDWGKCSTSCGKGMRHRRVYCQGFDGRDVGESDCSATEKPSGSDICDMGSCSANTWFFTEWTGQCSEECGTGIQTRKAHCSSNSEMDCDVSKKPDTSRTCVSAKDCSGKWFAGPWSQCSATCDEGTQTREVICLTFMRGQYRVGLDMQCPARDKPNNTAPCNLGKCLPQWYTTDWSECSATCGTGAQRREVKCLDSNQMPSQDCREEDRPLLRQACNVRTNCNEGRCLPGNDENGMEAQDTPVISEGCSDKFKNCHLVVQARLCKLKYYLVSCCASCSKPKT